MKTTILIWNLVIHLGQHVFKGSKSSHMSDSHCHFLLFLPSGQLILDLNTYLTWVNLISNAHDHRANFLYVLMNCSWCMITVWEGEQWQPEHVHDAARNHWHFQTVFSSQLPNPVARSRHMLVPAPSRGRKSRDPRNPTHSSPATTLVPSCCTHDTRQRIAASLLHFSRERVRTRPVIHETFYGHRFLNISFPTSSTEKPFLSDDGFWKCRQEKYNFEKNWPNQTNSFFMYFYVNS